MDGVSSFRAPLLNCNWQRRTKLTALCVPLCCDTFCGIFRNRYIAHVVLLHILGEREMCFANYNFFSEASLIIIVVAPSRTCNANADIFFCFTHCRLDAHLVATHHYPRDAFHCEVCPKKYCYRPILLRHRAVAHGEFRKYPCENCSKVSQAQFNCLYLTNSCRCARLCPKQSNPYRLLKQYFFSFRSSWKTNNENLLLLFYCFIKRALSSCLG